jgi:TPR repeat protein
MLNLKRALPAIFGVLLFAPDLAHADWNQANDEANRQRMMAEMRANTAAADRANEQSQRRQQQAYDNRPRSSGGSSSSASSASNGGGYTPYEAQPSGPASIVASYSFTVYRSESEAQTIARIGKEAAAGQVQSQYNLGRIYYTGYGATPRDDVSARKWFGAAAEQGHGPAAAQYGAMVYNGQGGPVDQELALRVLKRAADAGDAYGQALYAFFTLSAAARAQIDVRNPEAVRMLERAADAGQLVAQAYLGGGVYRLGIGAPADDVKAAQYSRLAADQGFAEAQTYLGRSYSHGKGIPQDIAQAVFWLRKAAAQNNAEALFLLGRLTIDGTGLTEDAVAGARMVRAAADAGNMEAIGFYGVLLQNGVGVAKDIVSGATMLRKAAESHDPEAEQNYAIALFAGQGVEQNEAAGVYWQKRAADDGDFYAAATYCVRATAGLGMPKNPEEGVRYGRIAAEAGLPRAETCLGYAYTEGNGVPKDLTVAKLWFSKAAQQNYADAVNALKQPQFTGSAN